MLFDYRKLKGRIIQFYGTTYAFARKLGLSDRILSRKLNGKAWFSVDDIVKIVSLLKIPPTEIDEWFFSVQNRTQTESGELGG
ncbi:MAG: DUF739 family protein [Oscillospiraceae bacterium]|nr:DUF739 family protein [Oscillospiraceae bacterium]